MGARCRVISGTGSAVKLLEGQTNRLIKYGLIYGGQKGRLLRLVFSIDKGKKKGHLVEDRKGRVLKMKESPNVSFDLV